MYQKSAVVVLILFVVLAFVVIANHNQTIPETAVGEMSPQTEDVTSLEADSEVESGRPAAKIDVRIACESALMYMSFMDGAAAEAFVAECVEGEHPEVIERYINELGVDGAII